MTLKSELVAIRQDKQESRDREDQRIVQESHDHMTALIDNLPDMLRAQARLNGGTLWVSTCYTTHVKCVVRDEEGEDTVWHSEKTYFTGADWRRLEVWVRENGLQMNRHPDQAAGGAPLYGIEP